MNTTTTSEAGVTYEYGDRYADPNRKDARFKGERTSGGYKIAEMWDNHHEIARLVLLGKSNVEISEQMKCTIQTVSNVKNSPVVRDKLALMRAARDAGTIDLAREIAELAPIALERVKEAVTTGMVLEKPLSASGILKEANGLLDRDQGRAIQRVDTRNLHACFTPGDIEQLKTKARKLAQTSE